MKNFIYTVLIFIILDLVWISLINYNYYITLCKKIQKEPFVLKIPPIIISYIILSIGLYLYCKFIINELKLNKQFNKYLITIIYGMLFGLIIYGTYSFTSCTYYKNYGYYDAFIDTIWGMILFTVSGLFFISFN